MHTGIVLLHIPPPVPQYAKPVEPRHTVDIPVIGPGEGLTVIIFVAVQLVLSV